MDCKWCTIIDSIARTWIGNAHSKIIFSARYGGNHIHCQACLWFFGDKWLNHYKVALTIAAQRWSSVWEVHPQHLGELLF